MDSESWALTETKNNDFVKIGGTKKVRCLNFLGTSIFTTTFDQNGPLYSSININWPLYVAMSEFGKNLGIDC